MPLLSANRTGTGERLGGSKPQHARRDSSDAGLQEKCDFPGPDPPARRRPAGCEIGSKKVGACPHHPGVKSDRGDMVGQPIIFPQDEKNPPLHSNRRRFGRVNLLHSPRQGGIQPAQKAARLDAAARCLEGATGGQFGWAGRKCSARAGADACDRSTTRDGRAGLPRGIQA